MVSGPYYGTIPPAHLIAQGPPSSLPRDLLLEEERRTYAALRGIRTLLNMKAPINMLPSELLIEIFLCVQRDYELTRWLVLPSVCRYWFYIASTTPELWRRLTVESSTNHLSTGLARSRAEVVDLELNLCAHAKGILSRTFKILKPHVHRIGSLQFRAHSLQRIMRLRDFLDSHSMPQLRSLYLHNMMVRDVHPSLSLSAERLPSLRSLRAYGMNILSSSIFSQLHTLRLADTFLEMAHRLVHFIGMARNLSNIEHLHVSQIPGETQSGESQADAILSSASMVHDKSELRKLRVLEICMEPRLVRLLLDNIVVPSTASVNIVVMTSPRTPNPSSPSQFLPSDNTCLPVLSDLRSVKVTVSRQGVTIYGQATIVEACQRWPSASVADPFFLYFQGEASKERYRDTSAEPATASLLNALLTFLGNTPGLHVLQIESNTASMKNMDWRATLLALPELRELTVRVRHQYSKRSKGGERGNQGSPFPDIESVIKQLDPEQIADLSHPRPVMPGVVPCPDLKCLRLFGQWTHEDTLVSTTKVCMENRRRALGRHQGLDELELHAHLRVDRDELLRYRREMLEELSSLVGNVYYDGHTELPCDVFV
ncbi:hypothetical protein BN946_scf184943.g75 [Trametes cinnabarina]|uniref:F-box domain-containing protein n=1 Tax=Pycnoporus cinnabarinus TaxID=5643 RepID=A0A060SCE9_PYCCI|nr:hypothetical protein BN946_scf184943.g75 [Trametes cinnabarina]